MTPLVTAAVLIFGSMLIEAKISWAHERRLRNGHPGILQGASTAHATTASMSAGRNP